MATAERLSQPEIKNLTAADMRDFLYGEIQALIENEVPDNIVHHYLMPAAPFGPELVEFLRLGPTPVQSNETDETGEPLWTGNQLVRAAINFAQLVDCVPMVDPDKPGSIDGQRVLDIAALVSSGNRISAAWEALLTPGNCKVVDNRPSDEQEAMRQKLHALLYKEPPEEQEEAAPSPEASADDFSSLLNEPGSDEPLDLDSLFKDGVDVGDFVADEAEVPRPTRLMATYEAMALRYEQVVAAENQKLQKIDPTSSIAGGIQKAARKRVEREMQRWETLGQKTRVENIMAAIQQLSGGGMPLYLDRLRKRLAANSMNALVFQDAVDVGSVTEQAYYTTLGPANILNAPSLMKVSITNTNREAWMRFENKTISGAVAAPLPFVPGGALVMGGGKTNRELENEFLSTAFHISFEIAGGFIFRSWLDRGFLESRAYTTTDPKTGDALDIIRETRTFSSGDRPPSEGSIRCIPTTAYFIRNVTVRSKALMNLSDSERENIKGRGGMSLFGIGIVGEGGKTSGTNSFRRVGSEGEITMNGTFLVAIASRYLEKAPNPDFEKFGRDNWI